MARDEVSKDLPLLSLEEARQRIEWIPPWPQASDEELQAAGFVLTKKTGDKKEP